jgi:restriction endonuclease S subunit
MPARYLLYAMRATAPSLAAKATGSTFEAVSGETLRSHEIPVAPLEEQRAIVAEIEKQFTRLDAGVAALRRMQANLKRYRASVLKAACEGKLVPTEAELARKEGRTYETGEQLLQRILVERRKNWKGRGKYIEPSAPESTGLMPLPDGWVWTTLGSVTSIQGGIAKDQKRKHDAPARFVPYLRVANVQRGYLDLSEIKELSVTEAEVEELRLVPGDLLFNEGGDRDKLGRGWIWNGEIPECIHQNHVFRARLMKDSLHPKFVSWYANSFGQKFFFDEGKHTTNLASISMSKLRALPLPIPPPAEQARIIAEVERRLSVVDELDRTVSANLRRAIGLRKSVLQRAFSGALVKTETRPTAVAASATPPVSKQRRHFARAVLSGEIVHRLHGERTFGRVKHQKIFHLCEHIARLPEIQGEYHREAAGPLDNKLIYANTTELKKQKWYAQVDRAGTGHEYKALAKAGGHRKYAERLWRDQLPAVERLIEMMRTWTTERCEIFSTVYAAWNDLLLWGREATDDAIVHEILHRWHESKKRIPEDKWRAAIGWMRREGLVPTGFGRPTAAPGPDDAQASGR